MTSKLDSDTPATVDLLGFSAHAVRVAKSVADYVSPKKSAQPRPGLVISIEGAWGAGKSTYLNLVKSELKAYVGNSELCVVEFDPWWLSQKENLTLSFFRALVSALPKEHRENVSKAMSQLASVSKSIPEWLIDLTVSDDGKKHWVGRILQGLKESGGKLDNWLAQGVSPRAARDRVAQSLATAKRGLVVIVDDIDRLEGHDALAVLRFVKSLGDLNGVVYLLAFSTSELHRSLREVGIGQPEQFLEKIVQASVPLPEPANWRMRAMILGAVSKVLGVKVDDLSADKRVESVLIEMISKPRDLARITNNVAILLEQVADDVDVVDFACIHALRTLDPPLYAAIRANKGTLTNSLAGSDLAAAVAALSDDKQKAKEQRREALLLTGNEGARRERVLTALFPKCPEWDEAPSQELLNELRRNRRVGLSEFFDTYFRLEVAADVLTNAEIQKLLSIESHDALVAELRSIAKGEYGAELLDGLIGFLRADQRLDVVNRATLALHHISHTERSASSWEIAVATAVLVAKQFKVGGNHHFRSEFIRAASSTDTLLVTGAFAWMVARVRGELGPQSGELGLEETFGGLIEGDEYQQFKSHFTRAMVDQSHKGLLLSMPGGPRLIRVWLAWDGQSMRNWGRDLVATSAGLIRFVNAYAGYLITADVTEAYFETSGKFMTSLQELRDDVSDDLKGIIDFTLDRYRQEAA